MKFKIVMYAVAIIFLVNGCSSERKQEKMWDTSVAADSDFVNLDTGSAGNAITDTVSKDTTNINQ